jgi:uncharacterized glyoxalase superfamily protein PhnB
MMTVQKITPVLLVDDVEPCVKFWTERLGFEKTAEVPEGDKVGFAIVKKGALELMYQSRTSVEKDHAALARESGSTHLYIEVDNLNELKQALQGAPVAVEERTTFYGAREIGFRDPGNHIVLFAEFQAAAAH